MRRGSIATVRSRSTAARGFRPIKNPPEPFSPKTLVHFFLRSPAPPSAHPRERARVSGDGRCGASGAMASPLAGARVHHRVSAPPSSGIIVAPGSTARRAAPRRVGGSRGLCSREARGLAGSGQRAGVPGTPTVGGARRNEVSSPLTAAPFLFVI
jgi:hypothetical protein